jgi:hypothetical protein
MPATHTATPILHTPCRRPTPQANNLPLPTTNHSLTEPTPSHKNLQPPQTHSTTGNPYPQSNTNLLRQPIPTATIKPQSKLKSSTHTHKSTTNTKNQTKPTQTTHHPQPQPTNHHQNPCPNPQPTGVHHKNPQSHHADGEPVSARERVQGREREFLRK